MVAGIPVASSVSPQYAPEVGGTTLTIIGDHFGGSSSPSRSVTVNGTVVSSCTWLSVSEVQCTTPPGTGSLLEVQVSVGDLTSQLSGVQLTYIPPPIITSITPSEGPALGGTTVTIRGSNFWEASSNPSVSVGGEQWPQCNWVSDAEIRCTTRVGVGVQLLVQVTIEGQVSEQNDVFFSYGCKFLFVASD